MVDALIYYYGENWFFTLPIFFLITWTIGLVPPLVLRYRIIKKPFNKLHAIITVALLWFINIIIFISLGSESKSHAVLYIIAIVSYQILRHRNDLKADKLVKKEDEENRFKPLVRDIPERNESEDINNKQKDINTTKKLVSSNTIVKEIHKVNDLEGKKLKFNLSKGIIKISESIGKTIFWLSILSLLIVIIIDLYFAKIYSEKQSARNAYMIHSRNTIQAFNEQKPMSVKAMVNSSYYKNASFRDKESLIYMLKKHLWEVQGKQREQIIKQSRAKQQEKKNEKIRLELKLKSINLELTMKPFNFYNMKDEKPLVEYEQREEEWKTKEKQLKDKENQLKIKLEKLYENKFQLYPYEIDDSPILPLGQHKKWKIAESRYLPPSLQTHTEVISAEDKAYQIFIEDYSNMLLSENIDVGNIWINSIKKFDFEKDMFIKGEELLNYNIWIVIMIVLGYALSKKIVAIIINAIKHIWDKFIQWFQNVFYD